MKRPDIAIVLSIISVVGTSWTVINSFKHPEIVYVDSNHLINRYRGMEDARRTYQQKVASWKANIDTLSSAVHKNLLEYEKGEATMSAKERELLMELIRTKQKQLVDYQNAINAQAKEEDAKMTGEVIAKINAYIRKFGEENGYTIVMAATEYGNIAYADAGLNVTDEILEGLNREYNRE